MPKIQRILEKREIFPYLKERRLLEQYKKVKRYLLEGRLLQVRFQRKFDHF